MMLRTPSHRHRLELALVAAGNAQPGSEGHFLRTVLRALMRLLDGDNSRFNSSNPNFRLAEALG